MIPNRSRGVRKAKGNKPSKNIEQLYRELKCRECKVVVTRMDFAKILGKFTKVKIKYESSANSTSPKPKQSSVMTSPNTNARLKSNENGMVLIHRKAYTQHPVKQLIGSKTQKSNVLKENNRLKRTLVEKASDSNYKKPKTEQIIKEYAIIFESPVTNNKVNDAKNKITLKDLLPSINESILPSQEWSIEYFPKQDEPKDDKVYDRIAAELDLMYNEKSDEKQEKTEIISNNIDEFPSIMDILNDNNTDNKNDSDNTEMKSSLESSDVEAMLLGKSDDMKSENLESSLESNEVTKDNSQDMTKNEDLLKSPENNKPLDNFDNPHSPSILDIALQKGIEEHMPCQGPESDKNIENNISNTIENNNINTIENNDSNTAENNKINTIENIDSNTVENNDCNTIENYEKHEESKIVHDNFENISNSCLNHEEKPCYNIETVTHVVFCKNVNGQSSKSVLCPKNLKFIVEFEGKPVEFIGAPELITTLEDLQILLQIVDESNLDSLHVLH